jgi:hypothetical protein
VIGVIVGNLLAYSTPLLNFFLPTLLGGAYLFGYSSFFF